MSSLSPSALSRRLGASALDTEELYSGAMVLRHSKPVFRVAMLMGFSSFDD